MKDGSANVKHARGNDDNGEFNAKIKLSFWKRKVIEKHQKWVKKYNSSDITTLSSVHFTDTVQGSLYI